MTHDVQAKGPAGRGRPSWSRRPHEGWQRSPPYVVKWHDDGHEGLVFPGQDARIEAASAKD